MKIQADVYLTVLGYAPMPKKDELIGWRAQPISDKQKIMLDKYGIAYARVRYKGQASQIIEIITKRSKKNLATPKQIQVLLKNNYPQGRIKRLTIRGASKIISEFVFT